MTYLIFEGSNGDLTFVDGMNPDQQMYQDPRSANPGYAWNVSPLHVNANVNAFGYDHDQAPQYTEEQHQYRQQQFPSVMMGYQQMPPFDYAPKSQEQGQGQGQQEGYSYQVGK
jgi:hypothetical protein